MGDEEPVKFYEGKLFWIGSELYQVTKMSERSDGTWIPVDAQKVDWGTE